MPPHFALTVQGVLYPDRSSKDKRLKGHLEMGISFILPPVLRLIPEDVLRSIADAVWLVPLLHNLRIKKIFFFSI